MISRKTLFALFTLIILEGYVVLSSELIAIRLTTPFVGSGTDTVSIIIAAVLMPLAFGYQAGGAFKAGYKKTFFSGTIYMTVREKLIMNMLISLGFLLFAIAYGFIDSFFYGLTNKLGITNRIALTTIYSLIFLVYPVYLLGQTIPLICNFFSRQRLPKIAGSILFFSTIGSFLGAVLSTLVLMGTIGVHNTAIVNFVILGFLITLLSKEMLSTRIALTWALVLAGVVSNSSDTMRKMFIVENNQYNTIQVRNIGEERHLMLNGNASSKYSDEGRKHDYIEFMERVGIVPIFDTEEPKDILVLGAGAFTLGADDEINNYDFVDIDGSLKEVAEEYILKRELHDNVTFHPKPARGFLMETQKKYDVIMLDAYSGGLTLPEHLATIEFFEQVKSRLKDDGRVIANMAVSANFANKLSRHLDNTFRAVFPHVSRHVIFEDYALWEENESRNSNVMYIYKNRPEANAKTIYTDKKNRLYLDRPVNK